ncbi:hypothetical protein NL676_018256 [Syzygium grande]|nr:hypothetical protein NL676_018256 [Syzygium grande]
MAPGHLLLANVRNHLVKAIVRPNALGHLLPARQLLCRCRMQQPCYDGRGPPPPSLGAPPAVTEASLGTPATALVLAAVGPRSHRGSGSSMSSSNGSAMTMLSPLERSAGSRSWQISNG